MSRAILVCLGSYWCRWPILVCMGLYWCPGRHTGGGYSYWSAQDCTGVRGTYWCVGAILVYLGPYWCEGVVLVCVGAIRVWGAVLVHEDPTGVRGPYWFAQPHTAVCCAILVCLGTYWCTGQGRVHTGGGLTRCRMVARMRRTEPISSGEKPMTAIASSTAR